MMDTVYLVTACEPYIGMVIVGIYQTSCAATEAALAHSDASADEMHRQYRVSGDDPETRIKVWGDEDKYVGSWREQVAIYRVPLGQDKDHWEQVQVLYPLGERDGVHVRLLP